MFCERPAKEVSAADDHGDLNAEFRDGQHLIRHLLERHNVEANRLRPGHRSAAELDHHTVVAHAAGNLARSVQ
jgi:hypothetical protein